MYLVRVYIFAAIVFFFDQVSKFFVVHYLDLENKLSINILPPFVNFRMAWNQGINFGLFGNQSSITKFFLILIASSLLIVLRFKPVISTPIGPSFLISISYKSVNLYLSVFMSRTIIVFSTGSI